MNDKIEKKIEKIEEKDNVLRGAVVAVIVLLMIGFLVVVVRMMNPRVDIKQGTAILKQMDQTDVAKVEKKIQKLEEDEREADEEWKNRPAKEKFVNAFVIGDSITQGLYEYGVLDQANVMADRGTEVSEVSSEKIQEHIAKAKELKPQALFLAYGMNDVEAVRGDADAFIKAYRPIIEDLKKTLPDTKIYINSILPAAESVISQNEWYGNIPEFNQKLEELCEEERVTFIDNTSLVKDEYYADDGIHMAPDYYTGWVDHMAEVAEL